ncbi:type II toxin-antitoxin system VapC family toxin [Actinomycetota bacterium]
MTIVDANVLLNAINRSAPDHKAAKAWLDHALSGGAPVGFAWVVLLAVLRLATRPGLFARPLTTEEATGLIGGWLGAPSATVVQPGARHLGILSGLLADAGTAGNLTSDAHIAALAIEHRATVVTFDADFDRFPGVRWSRPA